ncbi:putative ABC transport system ATP-binding protein [Acetomicrobium thermoterrenum DSM 13490]|uniref:Putative ABC transport system ATP-binding protein n=1 Tax=Acetomicrobium thermoterrenum DSM 13490 TaxID=1120987 RepID=A0A1H3F0L6_9BACT|nr:ATP-binding cassette domain-containing protein [Acetomicrobium thermoterrenum]SDX84563.1 putative ABC transport system ATP-binding protein [Acetomicrobium thermoterrenum DSM 13490]
MAFQLEKVKYKNILKIDKLQIPESKITCIIGESGSGKTTLLRLLNNLISPDEGSIFYKGRNIEDIDPIQLRREVVMLPQNPTVFSGSVKDNLLIGLEFAGKDEAGDEVLSEVLSMAQLDKPLSAIASELSGGEKQRLALARIMLLEPEVILLDEPTSALDEGTEERVIESVVEFAKRKAGTLIMVVHSKSIAQRFADVAVTIQGGGVVAEEGL